MFNNGGKQTTIKDLAKYMKVAPSTISRALRDYPDISDKKKKEIRELANKLGYQPDSIAQSLQRGRTKTIGVIVPEIKHDFFSSVLDGIEDVAYKAGYSIFVCKSNEDYIREVINTRSLLSYSVAGIIVSISQNTQDTDHFNVVKARNIPLVFFDRVCEVKANKVVVNDEQGAFSAVEHLIKSGYKRIAHLAGPSHLEISKNRIKGYKAALKKHRIAFKKNYIIDGGLDEKDGIRGFKKMMRLKPKPDAVFCVNDPVAIGVFMQCKEKKVRIPRQLAIVGFSDNPITALIDPPLTTVSQPAYEMGTVAAKLLLEEINNKGGTYNPRRRKLKTKLVKRGTT